MASPFTGLTPPPYWWLLALSCLGQVLWGIRLLAARLRGSDRPASARSLWFGCFLVGGLCGMAYGKLQSDAVFMTGQAVALLLGWRWSRTVNKEEER